MSEDRGVMNVETALRWLIEFGMGEVTYKEIFESWLFQDIYFKPSEREGWLEFTNDNGELPSYRLTQKALDMIKESKNE